MVILGAVEKLNCLIIALLLSGSLYAKNLGVLGPVFEMKEADMLEIVAQKLSAMQHSGAIAYHQKQLVDKAKNLLQTPAPVLALKETVNPRMFSWDPSISFPYDIKNHQGQFIYQKGTRLNPLDTVAFKGQWLFFNGEDERQKAWAQSLYKTGDKLILVRGSPMQLMEAWQLPVYFDQQGVLTRKIGIQQIPARVYQAGSVLRVEEIRLEAKES